MSFRASLGTWGLPNAHEGAIHAPKESLDVEHGATTSQGRSLKCCVLQIAFFAGLPGGRKRVLPCPMPDEGLLDILLRSSMDIEHTIAGIEQLERMFALRDTRPLNPTDISAANRTHDEKLANSPWFRLWRDYGVCCRPESPVLQPGEIKG